MLSRIRCVLCLVVVMSSPLARAEAPCLPGVVENFQSKFTSLRTGYFPESSQMQGGFLDRIGHPLRALQDFLKGSTPYVSVAMDKSVLPYGTKLRIPSIELEFHRCIEFRVVDTGGRFEGKGTQKIDICNDNREHALDPYTNGKAEIYVIERGAN